MAYFRCASGGGGSAPVLITKNITQNGTYNASADNADGYSQVKVEVSGGGSTLGEKTISTYGVFNASDDSLDGYSKVTNITGLETATASGGVASISDAVEMPCTAVVASIVPVQAGSGTPSPDNVRTLSGSSSVNLTRDQGTGTTPTTYTAAFGQTVYGGNYDFVNGGLVSSWKYLDKTSLSAIPWLSGTISQAGYIRFTTATLSDKKTGFSNIIASHFETKSALVPSTPTENAISGYNQGANIYISIDSSLLSGDLTTAEGRRAAFNSWINANNLEICYEKATADTYQLTPQTITTAQGVNNFYADTGDTAATYYREKLPELERLFYFEGVQSDTVQIPPAISLDEGDSFSEYLSYDTTTKKFTVLKAFSAMVTGWVYQFQNASSYGTGQFVVNDTAKMNYQVQSTSAGSKSGYTSVFDFAVNDEFWSYQNTNNGWPQQFLKVYLLDNVSVSGVVELDDETA